MNKNQFLILMILMGIFFSTLFYWIELKPRNDRKECFNEATKIKEQALNADNTALVDLINIARADYEKIFNNEYYNCLKSKGY